jgi:hypothetical protein
MAKNSSNNNNALLGTIKEIMLFASKKSKYASNYVWVLTIAAAANYFVKITPSGNPENAFMRWTASAVFGLALVLCIILWIWETVEKIRNKKP